jgi:hypothetical protein
MFFALNSSPQFICCKTKYYVAPKNRVAPEWVATMEGNQMKWNGTKKLLVGISIALVFAMVLMPLSVSIAHRPVIEPEISIRPGYGSIDTAAFGWSLRPCDALQIDFDVLADIL